MGEGLCLATFTSAHDAVVFGLHVRDDMCAHQWWAHGLIGRGLLRGPHTLKPRASVTVTPLILLLTHPSHPSHPHTPQAP